MDPHQRYTSPTHALDTHPPPQALQSPKYCEGEQAVPFVCAKDEDSLTIFNGM